MVFHPGVGGGGLQNVGWEELSYVAMLRNVVV